MRGRVRRNLGANHAKEYVEDEHRGEKEDALRRHEEDAGRLDECRVIGRAVGHLEGTSE